MRRLGPFVIALLATGMFGGAITGSPLILAASLLLTGAVVVSRGAVARPTVETAWATGPTPSGPTRPPAPARAATLVAMSPRGVAAALGRVEARELATSAWFGAGVGFCVLIYVLFALVYPGDRGSLWSETTQLAPWFAHPLVGMTILAVHRNVTRARRDGADELFATCPTLPATRTRGFLWTGWVPAVAFTVFFGAWIATVLVGPGTVYGPFGAEQAFDVISALVLTVGGVTLGVALGEWVRFGLAPAPALGAVLALTLGLATEGDPGWNPLSELSTFPPLSDVGSVFTARPYVWHLAWLVGLTVAVGAIAVARHRRDRAVAVTGALAVLVSIAAGIGATRPLALDDAALIADRIADPHAHQACTQGGAGRLEVCVYRGYEGLEDEVLSHASPVVAAIPVQAGSLTLRHGFPADAELADLPPRVRALLPDGIPGLEDGELLVRFDADDWTNLLTRFQVAFTALGLPLEAAPDEPPSVIAGEARGVVALWLAARGLDLDDALDLATAHEPEAADPFLRGLTWPESCVEPPVVWSAQDLDAARTLIGQPDREVAAVVDSGWDRWRDPATSTDALLAALGLPSVGPFDAVVARAGAVQEC